MTNKTNKIINKETKIWQKAYPEQKELLQKFSDKIKLELEMGV